ncbi:hypothetical protein BDR07DRAFT_1419141 [Suillus spraguei]|nr:hypothetical protein BDR07DRAFT_1419141 [Suillus spraguei]
MDLAQSFPVSSTEPQSPRKLDRVKKRLVEDRGYLSDSGKPCTAARTPRGSHPHRVSLAQRPLTSPQSSPLTTCPTPPSSKILFYHAHDPYYGFTNFSPDPIEYNGKKYPTSEHLFQSLKFMERRPELAEHIRTCSTRPRVVFDEAHRFSPEVRSDWLQVRIEMMDLVLWHKFSQNRNLKEELLSTGDAELVEDSDKDSFWGIGVDHKGQNQLGKALVRLRNRLRNEQSSGAGSKALTLLRKTVGR